MALIVVVGRYPFGGTWRGTFDETRHGTQKVLKQSVNSNSELLSYNKLRIGTTLGCK